jgi:hypothetical protein
MPKFRGAIAAPRHVLARLQPHTPAGPPPPEVLVIPGGMSIWGNDRFGDCVTAEEAAAKLAYSCQEGGAPLILSDAIVIQWANRHGVLNGAMLPDVMDAMARDGILGPDGRVYHDGPYRTVDWTSSAALQSAIAVGPVKLGVSANQLENVVQGVNGWHLIGAGVDQNLDHCVSLFGYSTAQRFYERLVLPVPQGIDPATPGFLLFTWGTVGFVDQATITAISGEAYVRLPTTPEQPMPSPPPPPPPGPIALAPGTYTVNGVLTVE